MWRINGVSMPGFGVACVVGVLLLIFRGGWPLWRVGVVFAVTWIVVDLVAFWQIRRKQLQVPAPENKPDDPPPP